MGISAFRLPVSPSINAATPLEEVDCGGGVRALAVAKSR